VQFLITVQHVLNIEVFDAIKSIRNVRTRKTLLVYIDMLTALPDATNDLTLPCHEQWAGAATAK